MQQTYNQLFKELPDHSRVWIYSSSRLLDNDESDFVIENVNYFTKQKWASHGEKIFAQGTLINNSILILAVDEARKAASGCSIDSSVHMIKLLEKELKIDFFNRFYVFVFNGQEIKRVHMNNLSDYRDWEIFDPLISNLGELRKDWLKPVSSHPLF